MPTKFRDNLEFAGSVTATGAVDLSASTLTLPDAPAQITATPADDSVVNAKVAAAAAIARTKLANGTAHRLVVNGANGALSEIAVGTDGQIPVANTGAAIAMVSVSGDATLSAAGVLTLAEAAHPIRVLSQRVQHSDLTDADGSQAIAIADFPANAIPLAAWVELDTAFSGGTVSAVTVKVGDAGDDDELFAATSVFTGASAGTISAEGAATGKFRHEAAYSPIATFTATDGNLADLDAGDLRVRIAYFALSPVTA